MLIREREGQYGTNFHPAELKSPGGKIMCYWIDLGENMSLLCMVGGEGADLAHVDKGMAGRSNGMGHGENDGIRQWQEATGNMHYNMQN